MSAPTAWALAPGPVRAASVVLGLVSAYHLAIALATVLLQPLLLHDILIQHPGASSTAATQTLDASTALSLGVHLPLFVLTAVLAWRLPTGHPLALRPATISQLFGVVFAYASTPPFHDLQPFVPVVIAVQAAVVLLLWIPPTARSYFAAHPRSRRSRKAAVPSQ